MTRIGVLATQGDVAENVAAARAALGGSGSAGAVSDAAGIDALDALIIPGGESTAISQLSLVGGTLTRIRERAQDGSLAVLGICAGLVMLARGATERSVGELDGSAQMGVLDVDIERNAFGRQRASFESEISMPSLGIPSMTGVFIRAPAVTRTGAGVEKLAEAAGRTVAVRQGRIIGTAFHPELAGAQMHAKLAELASS